MSVTYRVQSLDEIAAMFEEQAASAINRSKTAKTEKARLLESREAYAWKQAAHIVRQTTIDP